MKVDIFVHPEYASSNGQWYPKREIFMAYMMELNSIVRCSKFPILVNGSSVGLFGETIPLEHHLRSRVVRLEDGLHEYGQVDPKDFDKFKGLIDGKEDAEFRLHGSYFGECVSGMALQLLPYLKFNDEWRVHAIDLYDADDQTEWDQTIKELGRQERIAKRLERIGAFKNSKVRYGSVLYPPIGEISITQPKNFLRQLRSRPLGNIDFQLMDDQTRVFGMRYD